VGAGADRETVEAAVKAAEEEVKKQTPSITQLTLRGIVAMSGASITYRVEATAPPAAVTIL
jgi:hypothetical protein